MHEAAHRYYRYALDYIQKKFPIINEILVNGALTDVENRAKSTWGQVQYFLDRCSDTEIMQNVDAGKVSNEFCDNQSLSHDDIPKEVW